MDDNYDRLREVARMVTISVIESIAEGAIRKAGNTVKAAAAEVTLLVKETKIWQSSCDWLKKNISDIADLAGSAAKITVDGILTKLRGGMNTLLYKYISQKADDIYAELKNLVDEDALNYLQKKYGTLDSAHMHLLRDVADGIKSAGEILGRKLELGEVQYIQESLLSKAPLEKIIKFLVGGKGSRAYGIECRKHLYEGKIGSSHKGVVGGHNIESFTKTLEDVGFDLDDCIVNITPHPGFKGIYEIEYCFPAGNGKDGLVPNQYKNIKLLKTVYNPLIYSDEQIYEWGREAMDNGKIIRREIHGRASNGLGFRGYIDPKTQEITNFFPVLD